MTHFVGIDLGTTNSTAALFDGENAREVRSSSGSSLMPSVVYFGKNAKAQVGERARRQLERDPQNARTGFKRLMGTSARFLFPALRAEKSPVELSAALLAALREDVKAQCGHAPDQAVITVPALFELPQCKATAEAALLAGFTRVELVQEPVASALAAGWSMQSEGRWLVYDLGGGTFDVTLLEEADGFLRVVGHDGHNFLGGRDFDLAIYAWLRSMVRNEGVELPDPDAEHDDVEGALLRAVLRICEEAKIELSRGDSVTLAPIDPLEGPDGGELEFSIELSKDTLEAITQPLVDKSIEVCLRLLGSYGLAVDDIAHVVMVGGPAAMPLVRRTVESRLGRIAQGDLDPMTLVAKGASLHAAALGLVANPAAPDVERETGANANTQRAALHLRHPSMCRDTRPFLVGQILEGPLASRIASIEVRREGWQSKPTEPEPDGTFLVELDLKPKLNAFTVVALDVGGETVPVTPDCFQITQGVSIGDPPVARSVGVARSSDDVQVFFQRGDPLPAERSYQFFTVETVTAGDEESRIRIPLVQGEFAAAHLCQRIGELVIDGSKTSRNIEVGSEVEVTLSMDRGGHLKATARFPAQQVTVRSVAELMTPDADVDVMRQELDRLNTQMEGLRENAFATRDRELIKRVTHLDVERERLRVILATLSDAQPERAQQVRMDLLELSGETFLLEQESKWPEVDEDIDDEVSVATMWVSKVGSEDEQQLLERTTRKLMGARERRNAREVSRLLQRVRQLRITCFNRSPVAVEYLFSNLRASREDARDQKRAERLVKEGERALEAEDYVRLRAVNDQLLALMPGLVEARRKAFSSGVE